MWSNSASQGADHDEHGGPQDEAGRVDDDAAVVAAGRFRGDDPEQLSSTNPATGELLAQFPIDLSAEVVAAVAGAGRPPSDGSTWVTRAGAVHCCAGRSSSSPTPTSCASSFMPRTASRSMTRSSS